jgi:hypothetical protein
MFKKKKKDAEPQDSSRASPRAPRYSTLARVRINGFEGEAVLRNINLGGFCMESKTYAAIGLGEHYTMQINPESSANISPFELEVEVRWVRSTEKNFNSGFLISRAPPDRSMEKYMDHIKKHSRVVAS